MVQIQQMPVPSGEVHLGVLPQTESLRGENMRDHAEQHQEDGHGHHDHVMADAARERNRGRVNRVGAEWGMWSQRAGSLFVLHLRVTYWWKCGSVSPATLCQCPASSRSPSPGRRNAVERKAFSWEFTFHLTRTLGTFQIKRLTRAIKSDMTRTMRKRLARQWANALGLTQTSLSFILWPPPSKPSHYHLEELRNTHCVAPLQISQWMFYVELMVSSVWGVTFLKRAAL